MAAFNNHTLPSEAEPPYSKLIDPRWLELVMAKLSDVDNFNEKKKKLGARRQLPPAGDAEVPVRVKGKGKGKGEKGDKGASKAAGANDRGPQSESQA